MVVYRVTVACYSLLMIQCQMRHTSILKVLCHMQDDGITRIACKDWLICRVGYSIYEKHGSSQRKVIPQLMHMLRVTTLQTL